MIPLPSQILQYGAAVRLLVTFIDPIATIANGGVPVPVDISGSTNLLVCLLYPDQITTANLDATFYTNGYDGQIYYDTSYNVDLSQLGLFEIQGKVTKGGVPLLSEKGYFEVVTNVDNDD